MQKRVTYIIEHRTRGVFLARDEYREYYTHDDDPGNFTVAQAFSKESDASKFIDKYLVHEEDDLFMTVPICTENPLQATELELMARGYPRWSDVVALSV